MGEWKRQMDRFLSDERGQSTTEYILILSVVVMVAMKFKKTFEGRLTTIIDRLGGEMDKGMDNPP